MFWVLVLALTIIETWSYVFMVVLSYAFMNTLVPMLSSFSVKWSSCLDYLIFFRFLPNFSSNIKMFCSSSALVVCFWYCSILVFVHSEILVFWLFWLFNYISSDSVLFCYCYFGSFILFLFDIFFFMAFMFFIINFWRCHRLVIQSSGFFFGFRNRYSSVDCLVYDMSTSFDSIFFCTDILFTGLLVLCS